MRANYTAFLPFCLPRPPIRKFIYIFYYVIIYNISVKHPIYLRKLSLQ